MISSNISSFFCSDTHDVVFFNSSIFIFVATSTICLLLSSGRKMIPPGIYVLVVVDSPAWNSSSHAAGVFVNRILLRRHSIQHTCCSECTKDYSRYDRSITIHPNSACLHYDPSSKVRNISKK